MGAYSKTKKTRAANLLNNITNGTKRVWEEVSPKKIAKWLSPRKRHKENIDAMARDQPAYNLQRILHEGGAVAVGRLVLLGPRQRAGPEFEICGWRHHFAPAPQKKLHFPRKKWCNAFEDKDS
ncbi:hypothetical protein R3P38DRAFT_2804679 [Favolaschia claudopus]|uniref:Uncharacterized protein n=1 Tax=Favolaschia claudopus TaxID=2862362 RepID=A0AAV9ZPP7_9AGAR